MMGEGKTDRSVENYPDKHKLSRVKVKSLTYVMHGDIPLMLRWSYRALVSDSERPQLVRNYVCVFMYHQCSESLLTLVRVKGANMFFISRTGQLSILFSFICHQYWTYNCQMSRKTQNRLIKSLLAPYQEEQRDGQWIVCSRGAEVG